MATDPTSPHFGFRETETNNIAGFDIDLMQVIGVQAGHPIGWVTLPFDGLIPTLQPRRVDASIAAMIIAAERSQVVDFGQPYFKASQAIVVRDSQPTYGSLDELKGLRVAVQIGTVGALAASQVPDARVSIFDSTPLALQELANGNPDAMVGDFPEILYAIDPVRLTGLRVSGEDLSTEYYGIAFPKTSPIAEVVNEALTTLIASGRYAELYRKWFASKPPRLPMRAPSLEAAASPLAGLDLQLLGVILLKGAAITLMLAALSFSFGMLGGASLVMVLQTPWRLIHAACRIYIDFFRGTPRLVQLFLIYFGLPALLQSLEVPCSINRLAAAVTALSLNVAAYLAETLRNGNESIDRGQWEAADALGLSPVERMRFRIAPQALHRVLPPLANKFISLIKDTSLAAVIGFDELFRQGQLMVATTYRAFEIYIAVALVYLLMTTTASLLFKRLEARWLLPA